MSITSIHLSDIPPAAPPVSPEAGARAAYIAGLHELAATLETCPEVPLPFHGRLDPVTIHFLAGTNPVVKMSDASIALGCEWREGTSDYTDTGGGVYCDLLGELHGLRLRLTAPRDDAPAAGTGA